VLIAGFGLPGLSHEDDANRAVETAIDIYAKLEELKIACSIGVTTGRAFCGDVGTDIRREYALVGDIVNLSARLMAAAKKGILTDHDTYEAAKNWGTVAFEKQTPIKVKGKTNPITIYIPTRKKRNDQVVGTKSFAQTTIIGRDAELKIFVKTFRKLLESINTGKRSTLGSRRNLLQSSSAIPSRSLIIEGEAGVGKSRLIHQVVHSFKNYKQEVYQGQGEQLKSTVPYHAWHLIFEKFVDEKGQLPANIPIEKDLLPLLNGVLPIPNSPENTKIAHMSAQQKSEITQGLLVTLLKYKTKPGTLVILDNAQW
jgi:hypothetical protein